MKEPVIPEDLAPFWQRLAKELQGMGSVLVALSGGADSSLLLAAAQRAIPGRVGAVLCTGPLTPPWEAERARALAGELGIDLIEVDADELSDGQIAANGPERCYYCKRRRMMLLLHMAQERGYDHVAEGGQADDSAQDRPGSRAVAELGISSPLARAGLGKAQVRALGKALGLKAALAPSGACLATRVSLGVPLGGDILRRVLAAEQAVRRLVSGQVRVRDEFPLARLEFAGEAMVQAANDPLRGRLVEVVKEAGYSRVCLDLEGYGAKDGVP